MGLAEIFASSWFLFFYSGLLVLLTGGAIVRNHMSLFTEAKVAGEIVAMVSAAHRRDVSGKIEQLVVLNDCTGARILTHVACRNDDLAEHKVWRNPKSATARATANYLGAMAALPPERHSLEGLRPSRTMIEDQYRRLHRGLSGFGDFVIRLALLGTFMGRADDREREHRRRARNGGRTKRSHERFHPGPTGDSGQQILDIGGGRRLRLGRANVSRPGGKSASHRASW